MGNIIDIYETDSTVILNEAVDQYKVKALWHFIQVDMIALCLPILHQNTLCLEA